MAQSISTDQKEKLGTALNNTADVLRKDIRNAMFKEHGNLWDQECRDALSDSQIVSWDNQIRQGISPEGCLDLGNMGSVVMRNKKAFKTKFGPKTNNMITWLNELREVRNKWAHGQDITEDEWSNTIMTMLKVAQVINSDALEDDLRLLQGASTASSVLAESGSSAQPLYTGNLKSWFEVVRPHEDIRTGSLDESVFAANLSQVHLGSGRQIYSDSSMFFEKTYFTLGLLALAERVVKGLNGEATGENRVLSLQTGFGGGKTHALISLYHLVKLADKCNSVASLKALIKKTGQVKFTKAQVAVFTNATNDPIQGREVEPGLRVKTIWGEIAYQLGGKAAYERIRENDEKQTAPKGQMRAILESCGPALILIDELADYCISAAAVGVGASNLADQTISFVQELTESIDSASNVVLVATLPKSEKEVGTSDLAGNILLTLENRMKRVGQDTIPVGDDEIFEVIRRRLFEDLGDATERKRVLDRYMGYYEELAFNHELPDSATKQAYRKMLEQSYPFHPELINIFRVRWASNHHFQRTRGVLRMLGAVVADLWKRRDVLQGNLAMIHTSDLRLANLHPITAQIRMLNGEGYAAVIDADVAGSSSNAHRIDEDVPNLAAHEITKGLAGTILMGSFGSDGANKGMSMRDLKLAVSRPDTFNHSQVNNALDRLEQKAHYLHFASSGPEKRYWFHTKPNLNILINEAQTEVRSEDVHHEVLSRLKRIEPAINSFPKVIVGVNDPKIVPEFKSRTLMILGPEHIGSLTSLRKDTVEFIRTIATKRGDQDRVYRNALVFLTANDQGFGSLRTKVSEYLACNRLLNELTTLEADQRRDLERRKKDADVAIPAALASAFTLVSRFNAREGIRTLPISRIRPSLTDQLNSSLRDQLVEEEWLLQGLGMNLLKRSGLVPEPGSPISVQAIANAFIQYDDKPQLESPEVVLNAIRKYCLGGNLAVGQGSPGAFARVFFEESVPHLDLTSEDWYILDPVDVPAPVAPSPTAPAPAPLPGVVHPSPAPTVPSSGPVAPAPVAPSQITSLSVSGEVSSRNFNQLFQSFLLPLNHKGIKPRIRVMIEAEPGAVEFSASDPVYKAMVESARQLGLDLTGEEG